MGGGARWTAPRTLESLRLVNRLPGKDGAGLQEERGGTVRPTPDLVGGGGDGRRPGGAGVRLADRDNRVVLACVCLVEEDGSFWSTSVATFEQAWRLQ